MRWTQSISPGATTHFTGFTRFLFPAAFFLQTRCEAPSDSDAAGSTDADIVTAAEPAATKASDDWYVAELCSPRPRQHRRTRSANW